MPREIFIDGDGAVFGVDFLEAAPRRSRSGLACAALAQEEDVRNSCASCADSIRNFPA